MRKITSHALASVLWWSEGNSLETLLDAVRSTGPEPLEHIEQDFDESSMTIDARNRWLKLAKALRS